MQNFWMTVTWSTAALWVPQISRLFISSSCIKVAFFFSVFFLPILHIIISFVPLLSFFLSVLFLLIFKFFFCLFSLFHYSSFVYYFYLSLLFVLFISLFFLCVLFLSSPLSFVCSTYFPVLPLFLTSNFPFFSFVLLIPLFFLCLLFLPSPFTFVFSPSSILPLFLPLLSLILFVLFITLFYLSVLFLLILFFCLLLCSFFPSLISLLPVPSSFLSFHSFPVPSKQDTLTNHSVALSARLSNKVFLVRLFLLYCKQLSMEIYLVNTKYLVAVEE